MTVDAIYDPATAAERQLTLAYEEHAEAEQVARLSGDVTLTERHHQACRILLKAITAEHDTKDYKA